MSLETSPAPGGVNDESCLLWDNLALHKTAYVTKEDTRATITQPFIFC